MGKFVGKKLLVLGTNIGSVDIVNYARNEGAEVYVADYLPECQSEAKLYSDHPVSISTSDTESILQLVETENIDAVFAGISEFNLLQALHISERLNLRFYCSREQWDMVENKVNFRKKCQQYGISHPYTYFSGKIDTICSHNIETFHWPCIVKPVDGSSSMGISICSNPEEVNEAVLSAAKYSNIGEIIIEDYFEGEEFSAHYTIINGKAVLSSIDNRYPVTINDGHVTSIPIARVYPSSFLNEYMRQVNNGVIELCDSLGLEMGVLFVQGLYNERNNTFCIFEGGLRSAGEAPYRLIERVNGLNYMNYFVDYLLLGKVEGYSSLRESPAFPNHACCILSFVSKGGKVQNIIGINETVKSLSSIVDWECRYPIGGETPYGNTLKQIVLRFVLDCPSKDQLIRDIDYINSHVKVIAEDGSSLCVTFDSKQLIDHA